MKVAAGFAIVIVAGVAGYYLSALAAVWFVALVAAHTSPTMALFATLVRIVVFWAMLLAGFWLAVRLNRP